MNNDDKVKVKDEILSINGIKTANLISDIYDHIAAQANIQSYKTHHFNTHFAALIPYALGSVSYTHLDVYKRQQLTSSMPHNR